MVPEQETELLGLLCLLHRHADKIIVNEGQNNIVDFIGGGGGGGGTYLRCLLLPRNLPDFHCFRAWNLLPPFPTQTGASKS